MMEENKTKGFMQKPVVQFFVAVLAGLVVPLIFAAIFYKSFYHGDDRLGDVLEFFRVSHVLTNLILISLIPNFVAVFLLNMFDKWHYLRGVFVSIMIYLCLAFFL